MTVLYDPQVVASAVTVLLTVLAAIIGFIIREWMDRVTPFIAATGIYGNVRRESTQAVISEAIHAPLKDSTIMDSLVGTARLGEIEQVLGEAIALKDDAPAFLETTKEFRAAAEAGEIGTAQTLLSSIISSEAVDNWLTVIIGGHKIPVPPHDPSLPVVVPCTYEPNFRKGSFQLGLPEASAFGKSLQTFGLYKQEVSKFVSLIERMELKKLSSVIGEAAALVSADFSKAKDIIPLLQDIVDKRSQWHFRFYLANLAKSPLLIQRAATLHVVDKNGGRYTETLSLTLLRDKPDEESERYDASSPLIVGSESAAFFEFATTKTQAEMSAGDHLRLIFNSASAQCWVEFTLERAGLRRLQIVRSPKTPFAQ